MFCYSVINNVIAHRFFESFIYFRHFTLTDCVSKSKCIVKVMIIKNKITPKTIIRCLNFNDGKPAIVKVLPKRNQKINNSSIQLLCVTTWLHECCL